MRNIRSFHLLSSALCLTFILKDSCSSSMTKNKGSRIFAGFVTRAGDMPFIGGLATNISSPPKISDMFCTAFLIARQWVLTAGHCYTYDPGPVKFLIRAPPEEGGAGGRGILVIPVQKWNVHPDFNTTTLYPTYADISLLYLVNGIDGAIPPVRIATKKTDKLDTYMDQRFRGMPICVAGYGLIDNIGTKTHTLRKTYVYLKQCDASWNIIPDKCFCYVTGPNGEGPCPADSGAPVMLETADRKLALGVHSTGNSACRSMVRPWGNQGLNVRISGYRAWIRKTMCDQDGSILPYSNYTCS